MRPLLALLRRMLGLEVPEAPREDPAPSLPGEGEPPTAEQSEEIPATAPREDHPPGRMPESARGVLPGGDLPPGSAGEGTDPGRSLPPAGRDPGRWGGAAGEVVRLAGPPADEARRLSELLRLQRRMGSTVGTFGEEVL